MGERPEVVDHYGAYYREFAADVYVEARRAAFGEDVGQNSWLTVDELERFVSRLQLQSTARLLDVGCGSGGPSMRARRIWEAVSCASTTACFAVGTSMGSSPIAERWNGTKWSIEQPSHQPTGTTPPAVRHWRASARAPASSSRR